MLFQDEFYERPMDPYKPIPVKRSTPLPTVRKSLKQLNEEKKREWEQGGFVGLGEIIANSPFKQHETKAINRRSIDPSTHLQQAGNQIMQYMPPMMQPPIQPPV
jgi:hypothetical protein